jgi:hypothetical protein
MITGSDKGSLISNPYPLTDRIHPELIPAHNGQVTQVVMSSNGRYLFSGGSDGSIFIFQIGEKNYALEQRGMLSAGVDEEVKDHHHEADASKKSNVDAELADVVLVMKSDMEKWKERQDQLNHDLTMTRKRVETAHEETKKSYSTQLYELEEQKDADIRDLQKRYDDLRRQKEIQDRQNLDAFKLMEHKHLDSVEKLEDVYKRKINIEEGNYLKLEQEKLEMKKYYEQKIGELRGQN